jgi:hypothetical protein
VGELRQSPLARSRSGRLLVLATLAFAFVPLEATGAGVAYTYDPIGRIATGLYDNNLCIAYSYDAAGNRMSQTNATATTATWGSARWGCFSWSP